MRCSNTWEKAFLKVWYSVPQGRVTKTSGEAAEITAEIGDAVIALK
jgi:hypothetical protein